MTSKSYNAAAAILNNAGLVPKQKNVFNADKKGTVEKQSVPPFTTVLKGSDVILSVSTGTIKLPDVRGMNIDDARSNLPPPLSTNVHTRQIVTHVASKDQQVAKESPKPGEAYEPGQRVTLTVYEYEQPQPTCTTAPPSTPDTGLPSGLPTGGPSAPSTFSSSSDDIPTCPTSGTTSTPAGGGAPAS